MTPRNHLRLQEYCNGIVTIFTTVFLPVFLPKNQTIYFFGTLATISTPKSQLSESRGRPWPPEMPGILIGLLHPFPVVSLEGFLIGIPLGCLNMVSLKRRVRICEQFSIIYSNFLPSKFLSPLYTCAGTLKHSEGFPNEFCKWTVNMTGRMSFSAKKWSHSTSSERETIQQLR